MPYEGTASKTLTGVPFRKSASATSASAKIISPPQACQLSAPLNLDDDDDGVDYQDDDDDDDEDDDGVNYQPPSSLSTISPPQTR